MRHQAVCILLIMNLGFLGVANSKVEIQGFNKKPHAQEISLSGPLMKFSEVGPHFEIVIEKSAAIYLLPKDKHVKKTRSFLQKAQTSQTTYVWVINPMTQQIYQVRPAP